MGGVLVLVLASDHPISLDPLQAGTNYSRVHGVLEVDGCLVSAEARRCHTYYGAPQQITDHSSCAINTAAGSFTKPEWYDIFGCAAVSTGGERPIVEKAHHTVPHASF